ncbi:MAG: chemotaxis response regulator protein-glutamate methylesterase [Bryobacterales bacterium]|nr:chemotaxis response regulator protein-glutamate methylesterase [Acidobacteriota bacterium]MCB9383136.1 chemotaxis response regulator protein-glutamate methylesterase [Bryobacterales bacterium]
MADWAQPSTTSGRIRVLVVDDSVVIRRLVTLALGEDPAFEVVGIAANGKIALQKIPQVQPDVVTLDIEMPEMDGLETLRRIKKEYPRIRVVMFSTLTQRGAHHTFEALSLGADEYVTKAANVGSLDTSLASLRGELGPKIRQFFQRPAQPAVRPAAAPAPPKPAAPAVAFRPAFGRIDIVAIAVSTGGPNALAEVFPALPSGLRCPVVITQHMPPMFTRLLAERLDAKSPLRVFEASDGMEIEPASAYVAPGDHHLTVRRVAGKVVAKLNQDPPENSCRPAADVMFRSVAEAYGGACLAVVLTGMGQDGLAGTRVLKQAGAKVLAQDEASSVVWGMPGHVVQAGLADEIAPIGQIASSIARLVGR